MTCFGKVFEIDDRTLPVFAVHRKSREADQMGVNKLILADGHGGPDQFNDQLLSRRRILNWFVGTSAGALIASILYPVTRYLIPPKVEESTARTVTLSTKPEDVKPNSGEIFRFGSEPGILIRTPDGDLRAFTAICTHLACIVQYRPDLSHIWCACHNGHYDLNGINIAGPPPKPLEQYVVNVREDKIVVSKSA
jgi:Rieske Fe-S protein